MIQNSNIFLFADDIKIFRPIKTNKCCALLQDDISRIERYMDANQLSMSIHKSAVIHIMPRKNSKFNYTFNNQILPKAQKIRDLGVLIDENLTFKDHIANITTRAHKMSMIMRKIFPAKTKAFYLKLFSTYFARVFHERFFAATSNNTGKRN